MRRARIPRAVSAQLSAFEAYCLGLYGVGWTREEISVVAHFSPRTVGAALTIAKEKLGARNLTHAALMHVTENGSISV
jgi:DNA-binding CsgD family transcriptional regulator